MTVSRLFSARTSPPTVSFVIGRSFIVGLRGAEEAVLAMLEDQRGRDRVTVEELMGYVPLGSGQVADLVVVTVDGPGGDEASRAAGALSDPGSPERRITVVARGTLAVDVYSVGGSRRFAARGVRPFVLAEFRAVTAFAVLAETDTTPTPSQLTGHGAGMPPGVAWAHGLAWASADVGVEENEWDQPVSEQTVVLPRGSRPPPDIDDTVISFPPAPTPPRTPAVAPTRASTRAPLPPPPIREPELEETIPRVVPPARHVAPGAAHRAEPEAAEETVRRFAQIFPVFRLGTAAPEALNGTLYLGRDPRIPPTTRQTNLSTRALPSPTHTVSSTHASLERSGTTIVVTDLGSRNGTVVHLPGVGPRRLRAGESIALPPDSRVDLGDDNVVYILSPAPVYSSLEFGDNR